MQPTGPSQAISDLGFSPRDVKFLERVVAGGRAGGAGTRYEDWYATFRLLLAARTHVTGGPDIAVETQATAFVNDVVVHDSVVDYCQAKTSPTVAWDAKLRRQFRLQHRLCRARQESHGLRLVTPHPERLKRLRRTRPGSVTKVTGIEVFPQVPPWDSSSPAIPTLLELSADAQAGPSQVEALAKAYASALVSTPAGQRCLASAATEAVRALPTPLVRSTAQPPTNWPAAAAILAAIPGLSVVVDRGLCTYRHGPERGIVAACDAPGFARFLDRVVERRPTTFRAFTKELP